MPRAGGNFTAAQLEAIDVAHRAGAGSARCPHDHKPLVTTTWNGGRGRMVYFLCRMCARIGAISYESVDPSVPGRVATPSRPSSARRRAVSDK